MDIAIMIEGQDGLTWPCWQRLVQAVEALGFAGLYRSDHFTNADPPDKDSLELWLSLAWLASHTTRIEFGPLVTPVSFRHPAFTARMASQLDDLAAGRLTLGVGAGWQVREHTAFGFDLLPPAERMDRFEEGLEVMTRLLRSAAPVSFQGRYYSLHEATLRPRPQRSGGPPLLIGGNGPRRTLPLAARYADEWNAVLIPAARCAELNAHLDHLLAEQGRPARALRRSLMTGIVFGRDDAQLNARLAGRDPAALRARGLIVGVGRQVQEQLHALAAAGVQRVMLQWLALDDLDGLEALAAATLPDGGASR